MFSSPPSPARAVLIRAGQIAVTLVLFAICNEMSVHFEVENGVSILFPATAIAILSVMQFGPWAAVGIILGTVATPWGASADVPSLVISGIVSSIEGLIPWAMFRWRRDLHRDLSDMKSLMTFLIFGCVLNTAFSAIVGNLIIVNHPGGLHLNWEEIFVWWIADFVAALLLATPILAFGGALLGRYRETRTLANTLQILTTIVLLGWAAAFAIRTYLNFSLEESRFAEQREWVHATEVLNRIQTDFTHAISIADNDPDKREKLDRAAKATSEHLVQLKPLLATAPESSRQYPITAQAIRAWFIAEHNLKRPGDGSGQSAGRQIVDLREAMERANNNAWLAFSVKRHKITVVVTIIDALVLLILVMASATLIMTVSHPLGQLRAGVQAMRNGTEFDASRIRSRYVEFRSLAETLEETARALRSREVELELQTEAALTASKHKSDFLAKMSHELRTPLNSIIGFSELLIEQNGEVDAVRRNSFLQNVANSARHLLGLINDLLDLSKVEAGKMPMRFESVDLRTTIRNTVSSTAPLFDRKHQRVEMTLPAEPMIVRADPARIEQVLLNLLSNANKFSPDGETISVRAAIDERTVRIEVADCGIGISEADQARIFGEFEQVHATGSLSAGTGLGLALAKRFVEAHGGTIEVESVIRKGSVFRVTLPRL